MTQPNPSFDRRNLAYRSSVTSRALGEPQTERWPLAARASLVISLCGLFWGGLGAVVLHLASR